MTTDAKPTDTTSPQSSVSCCGRWSMGRAMMIVLGLGFLGLMMDIRVEHVEVVRDDTIGWVPIIYSGLMGLASLLAAILWNKVSRLIMMLLFAVGFAVGGLGMYEHNHGRLARPIQSMAKAWTDSSMEHPHGPPQNAPLAFAGMGLVGVIACLKKFNS